MANKKISELAVRTPSLSDLMLVGDPSTGYSYKATISSLSTLLEANISLDDLNDVTITSPTAGQVLSYNGTAWVNDTNGITGSGTTNYVPKFTSSSAIGNSQIFDNGTNVGIGTATPSDKFSVEGFISTNGTAGTGGIMLRQSGSEITRLYATPSRTIISSTQQIDIGISYGLHLTVFPSGNIGVKISDNTDSGDAFQVLGTVKFRTINNATTDTDKFIVSDGGVIKYRTGSEVLSDIGGAAASSISGTTNYIPKFTSSSAIGNSQIFDNGTNVGIGTTSPLAKLQVSGGRTYLFSTDNYSIGLAQTAAQSNYMYLGTASDGTFYISNTGGTARVTVQQAGNVGIGTTTPQTQLDIANGLMFGTIDAFPSATYDAAAVIAKTGSLGSAPFNNAGSIVYRARVTSTAGRSSHIFYTGSPSTERMRLDESGRLGIGTTSPTFKLDVIGGIRVNEDGAGTKVIQIRSDFAGVDPAINVSTNNALLLQTNNTERMRITSGGDVGIGTTTPGTKLEVNGAIKTAAPSGGTAKPFKIGAAATVTPTSQNRTIEIEIDGTTYYLTAKTTND